MALEEASDVRVEAVRPFLHTAGLKMPGTEQVCVNKRRRLYGLPSTRVHRCGWGEGVLRSSVVPVVKKLGIVALGCAWQPCNPTAATMLCSFTVLGPDASLTAMPPML